MSVGALPIVFVGTSLSRSDAEAILRADFRPPIQRGDLDGVPKGAVVGIIDGVFDQNLAVSPSEIRSAIARGVRVFGAASMGALRAVEVPGVIGVGRVYELYRRGTIESDDEVAVSFDPETGRALCVPLVNVRYAVERLSAPRTISRELARGLVRAARKLPYWDRLYPRIIADAGLGDREEAAQLAQMLAGYDLKRDDAISLLEQLRDIRPDVAGRSTRAMAPRRAPRSHGLIHLWEFGPPIPFRELVVFLACTGELRRLAIDATRTRAEPPRLGARAVATVRARLLALTTGAWSWATEEEVEVSLADLGIERAALAAGIEAQMTAELRAMALLRANDRTALDSLRLSMFFDDLALKRAAARADSLRWLADRGRAKGGDPTARERAEAATLLARSVDARDDRLARQYLSCWGITVAEVDEFVERLALARRPHGSQAVQRGLARRLPFVESTCLKARGSRRFCVPMREAARVARRLARVVGVTRVAMITQLGTIGIPNAQAFRPDGQWSSTVGSGKSTSAAGARVGAVMEEVEKWAQERYVVDPDATASYAELAARERNVVNPATLDLPYDSCYRPELDIGWRQCWDLITGRRSWIPLAALTHRRLPSDLYFSPHGGRKTVTTNGLASGLTVAEALTHGLCEVIERHARATAAIEDGNPGAPRQLPRRRVDLSRATGAIPALVRKIERSGNRVSVADITGNVRVPTFAATILLPDPEATGPLFGDGWRRASGWACHPDPVAAVEMAILEASQTVMTHTAGAREDLVLAARSLGRHDRTDAIRRAAALREVEDGDRAMPLSSIRGFASRDASQDVRWIVERLREAGCEHALVAELSLESIRPARVIRVVIPGLETINPFHTGLVPRLALLCDLL